MNEGTDNFAGPVDQSALTVVAELDFAGHARLAAMLGNRPPGADPSDVFPFDQLPSVHFGRFVLLDASADLDGNAIPPALVFIIDFDGPVDDFVRRLVTIAGPALDRLFSNCADYPKSLTAESRPPSPGTPGEGRGEGEFGRQDPPPSESFDARIPPHLNRLPDYRASEQDAARLDFLTRHRVIENTLYVNWVGRTVAQVRQEAQLRDRIEPFIDQSRPQWLNQSPTAIRVAVQQFVRSDPSLKWATGPLPPRPLSWTIGHWLNIVGVVLLGLFLLPLVLLILPLFAIVLRRHEIADVPDTGRPDLATLRKLAALEDHVVQNQFTALGVVKRGRFRRSLLWLVLYLLNVGNRLIFNKGSLSGVKTIHFARWVFLNDKRRLIFASNYDGSLESYMDDFVDKVSWGLNAAFSNGNGYPRTRWLILDGARDEQAFKNFLHAHQLPTQVCYAAYPTLSALNIKRNAEIRAGLFGPMTDEQARQWLALL